MEDRYTYPNSPPRRAANLPRIAKFDQMPDSFLLTAKEVCQITSRSRTSLWRDVKDGRLAPPVRVGARSSRWTARAVRNYMGVCHDK